MSGIDLNELDPGIRRTVAFLREHGFDTTDSGDGVSKFQPDSRWYVPDDPEAWSQAPHVVIRTTPDALVGLTSAVYESLVAHGINFDGPATLEEAMESMPPSVEGSFRPGEKVGGEPIAIVAVLGIDDAMMFPAAVSPVCPK